MNTSTHDSNFSFMMGLVTGTCVGAGLLLYFAPRARAEVRDRLTMSARSLGAEAADRYDHASARVAETITEVTRLGQNAGDDLADAAVRGAQHVERFATAAKSDRVLGAR